MRRWGSFSMLLILFFLVVGCQTSSRQDVYYVLFDGMPNIFDRGIYFRNIQIGDIVSQAAAKNNIYRLAISIGPEHKDLMTDNIAFFISTGRLEYTRFSNFGNPLPPEARLSGFHSKSSLLGFRVKNIMRPLSGAAAKRADRLNSLGG